MKKTFITIITLSILASCGGNDQAVKNDSVAADSTKKDTITTANKFILEDLLNIADEKALIAKYGADHVKYDTIWGPEGDFGFGTYIDKGSVDAVQIF